MPNLSTTIPQGNTTSPGGAHIRYGTEYDENNKILSGIDTSDYDIVFIPEDDTPIDASNITFTSNTGLTSTNVSAALNELNTNITELDNNVSDKVELLSTQAILKTGGTMTGPLIAAANPTENMEVATKQYVDNNGGAFFAIYNETTFEDLKAAYDQGKIIQLTDFNWNTDLISTDLIPLRFYQETTITYPDDEVEFYKFFLFETSEDYNAVTGIKYNIYCDNRDGWTYDIYDFFYSDIHKISNTPIEYDEKSYLRPIIVSQSAPTPEDGYNGDIWFQY